MSQSAKRTPARLIEVARSLNPNVVGEHAAEIANQLADVVQRMAQFIKEDMDKKVAQEGGELCLHCTVVDAVEDFYLRQQPGEEEVQVPIQEVVQALGQAIGETLATIEDPAIREKSVQNTMIMIQSQVQEALAAGLVHPEHGTKQ